MLTIVVPLVVRHTGFEGRETNGDGALWHRFEGSGPYVSLEAFLRSHEVDGQGPISVNRMEIIERRDKVPRASLAVYVIYWFSV